MVRLRVTMKQMRWHVKEVNQEETCEDGADEMNPEVLHSDGSNDMYLIEWDDENITGENIKIN